MVLQAAEKLHIKFGQISCGYLFVEPLGQVVISGAGVQIDRFINLLWQRQPWGQVLRHHKHSA